MVAKRARPGEAYADSLSIACIVSAGTRLVPRAPSARSSVTAVRTGVTMRTVDILRSRIRAEYREMPGLLLTPEQVQRLCGIERMLYQLILNELVDAKFLCVKVDGRYARLTEGCEPSHEPARSS